MQMLFYFWDKNCTKDKLGSKVLLGVFPTVVEKKGKKVTTSSEIGGLTELPK